MPLFELFYLGYMYLLSVVGYGLVSRKWALARHDQGVALALGALVAVASYVLYQVSFYLRAASIYEAPSSASLERHWYNWIDYPVDLQLLLIYTIKVGAFGGWLYRRLVYHQKRPSVLAE